ASARVFTAELRQLLNRDAPLEAVQEMRPRVRIHHGVAGIDLENIRSCRVERAQPHGFRSGLHDVGPSTRGGGGAAAEGRACGEEAARRHRRQQAKDAADTDEPPAGHAVRRQMGLEGVLVQLVHVLQAVTGRLCELRLHRIGLDHVLPAAVLRQIYGGLRGRDVLAQFDLVAANSGGAIVAAALACDFTLSEIDALFGDESARDEIFVTLAPWERIPSALLDLGPKYRASAKL